MNRVLANILPIVALALLAGCSTPPSSAPQGQGVTRVFANVRGIT